MALTEENAVQAGTSPGLVSVSLAVPRQLGRFARRQPVGAVSLALIVLIVLVAILAPYLRTSDPEAIGSDILLDPSWDHWFGTNRQGMDMWSRVVYGARPSLLIGAFTVAVGLGAGIVFGTIAGYVRGAGDFLIMRISEFIIAFPPLFVGIIVTTALKPGLRAVLLSITLVVVAASTRVIRGAVLQQRELAYVEAARVLGASPLRVMFRHIVPNILPLGIVLASAFLPTAILFEAALTFLGFGLEQGEPSWGADLSGSARTYFTTAPWLAIFPGVALSITVLAFNLLGDSLRDVLDPRLRGTRV